uniref:Transmembrane protein 188 n=1 Tax=Steinernema glaseri TaxID=37863 RepID=A0A1I7Y5S9_9BILA
MENANNTRLDETNTSCDGKIDVVRDDLKFFERRLTEVMEHMQPTASFFLFVILSTFFAVIYLGYLCFSDPNITMISFYELLEAQKLCTVGVAGMVLVITILGVHKRVVAPRIIVDRVKTVLVDFCLSCDEEGKLIIKPTPRPHKNLA